MGYIVALSFSVEDYTNRREEVTRMRKYSSAAQRTVKNTLHKFKRGKLKNGGSGKIVRNRKQAIAIGLSEARQKGKKVPARSPK